ncbi:MAG: hypothetical protein RL701_3209 [Pseudomonadota bacterium]
MLTRPTSQARRRSALRFVYRLCLGAAAVGGGGAREARAEPAAAAAPAAGHGHGHAPEVVLGVADRGIFPDLDARVQLSLPKRLGDTDKRKLHALYDSAHKLIVLYDGEWPIKVYPVDDTSPFALNLSNQHIGLRPGDHAELSELLTVDSLRTLQAPNEPPPGDRDGDGIPDPLDVLIGAHKAALNADRYDGHYESIAYPLGDVPRSIGVCTDVVIRALRNAGIDLQRAVHEDLALAPRAYPSVKKRNPSIDHRRVKSLLPYFARHFERHAAQASAADPYRPGDIVFMDTFPDRPGTEHVGVVSDELNPRGLPLIINNWTDGTVTRAMDLLSFVPVTERFRVPARAHAAGPIAATTTRLVVVLASGFETWHARLQRYERTPGASWKPVGAAMPAVLGGAGYGWGDGLHGSGAPAGRPGPQKREGDKRSPAGVFALGTLHGYAATADNLRLTYRQADAHARCVDDPNSALYNQIVTATNTAGQFRSAEHMLRDDDLYEFALDLEHNRAPVTPGHGSCIFVHVWGGPDVPVTGCTALSKTDLQTLLVWLKPDAAWVALPESEYRALRDLWALP